jgi:hypothetical protein
VNDLLAYPRCLARLVSVGCILYFIRLTETSLSDFLYPITFFCCIEPRVIRVGLLLTSTSSQYVISGCIALQCSANNAGGGGLVSLNSDYRYE